MLNPPLSLLSDDLLAYIVEHVAKLPFEFERQLYNLSLADRVFTQSCQKYLFRTLKLGKGNRGIMSKKLTKMEKIMSDKPSFTNQVRNLHLTIENNQNAWLFDDPTFINILQLLAKSPTPPHELHFGRHWLLLEDPILIVGRLVQSFFSQTLTILHLDRVKNVPLPLFLICPKLREVLLDQVGATEKTYDKYPDDLCSGREFPALELLDYRASQSLVKQMITPPPRFNTPAVSFSNLRILTLSPHEKEEMACLQSILDAACNTLEELYLTSLEIGDSQQLPLSGLVNLSNLSCLHVFALYAIINLKRGPAVLRDINVVLDRIPESNKVTNLSFEFEIVGKRPFRGCIEQDWVGMFDQVIRISAGKPLEMEIQLFVSTGELESEHSGAKELYMQIMNKSTSLSDYPKICTHSWNPTCWDQGVAPFPRGQVRNMCRR